MQGCVALHVSHGAFLVFTDLLKLLLQLALGSGLAIKVALHACKRVLHFNASLLSGQVLSASTFNVLAHGINQLGLQRVVGTERANLTLEFSKVDA